NLTAPIHRSLPTIIRASLCLCLLALSLPGCRKKEGEAPTGGGTPPQPAPTLAEQPPEDGYTETGDLPELQRRGRLRILAQRKSESYLPREGYPPDLEKELAGDFATTLKLEPVMVYVESFKDLIPALLEGKGDLIADNMAITAERKKLVSFSIPLALIHEQIIARAAAPPLAGVAHLAGRTIGVQEGTSFLETLSALKKKYPGIAIALLPGSLTSDDVLDRVAEGRVDLAVDDSNVLEVALQYRSDVAPVLDLPGERALAWAGRPGNPALLQALNDFLAHERLSSVREEKYLDDLPAIRKRKTIRMITRNHPAAYFLWRGELRGFEYDLAKEFARRQGLRLQVHVVPDREALFSALTGGKGDFVAAFIHPDREREGREIAFSSPYRQSTLVLVTRAEDFSVSRLEDLAGKTVLLPPGSPARGFLDELAARGIAVTVREAPPGMTTDRLLDQMVSRRDEFTVLESQILAIECAFRRDIREAFSIGTEIPDCWATRAENPELRTEINAFLASARKEPLVNVLYNKYFKEIKTISPASVEEYREANRGERISPYDDMARRYAEQYGFLWRAIVSQMYQESRFNPKALSWSGAVGLMQVQPETARQFGFTRNLEDPEIGIHAGVKYLRWIWGQLEPELDLFDRFFFSLAAYNAGIGHVSDARKLAKSLGLDPQRWFGNVEKAMTLLSYSEYAEKARHGYVRGEIPVNYVRQIVDRFRDYSAFSVQTAPRRRNP
ncbi:MAG: transporter substrate-binding domain-containing protein, partial [Candidatus Aureabacteria bacterium]|nr:transporter substrate-binding domain-containing protein [Candidatus Auribacterota bacterium]